MTFSLTAGPFHTSGWSAAWASLITAANALASYVQSVKGYSSHKYKGVQVGRMPSFAVSYNDGSGYISASYIEWVNAMRAELGVPAYTLSDAFLNARIPYLDMLNELEGVAGWYRHTHISPPGNYPDKMVTNGETTYGTNSARKVGYSYYFEQYAPEYPPTRIVESSLRKCDTYQGDLVPYPIVLHYYITGDYDEYVGDYMGSRLFYGIQYWDVEKEELVGGGAASAAIDENFVVIGIKRGQSQDGYTPEESWNAASGGDLIYSGSVPDSEGLLVTGYISIPSTETCNIFGCKMTNESVPSGTPPALGEGSRYAFWLFTTYLEIHILGYIFRVNEE